MVKLFIIKVFKEVDFLILKISKSGAILREIRLKDNNSWDQDTNVLKTKDNCIYLTGIKLQNNGKRILKLLKLDSCGSNIIWDKTLLLGNYKSYARYDITEDKYGNLVCFYLLQDSISFNDHIYIMKFDRLGNKILNKMIEYKCIYQSGLRFIQNHSDDNCYYVLILKDTPDEKKVKSINNIDISLNQINTYEILKLDENGNILIKYDLPTQNDLDINFYNYKKQFVGFAENDFSGWKEVESFNPSSPSKMQRLDSSYLSLKIYDSTIQIKKETLIKKFKLEFNRTDRSILAASNIVKGADNSYAFLYKYNIADSSFYHFVKTDLDGNILFDKEIRLDPYVFSGAKLLAEDKGFVILSGIRKINERYVQHITKLFMMKLDLNGNYKKF